MIGIRVLGNAMRRGAEMAEKAQTEADEKPSISVNELVGMRYQLVRAGGKLYKVTVEEIVAEKRASL